MSRLSTYSIPFCLAAIVLAYAPIADPYTVLGTPISSESSFAQQDRAKELRNGELESFSGDQADGWIFTSPSGGTLQRDDTLPQQGQSSALIDSTQSSDAAQRPFANLMQTLNAEPFRGKRVRFRAAVRTEELKDDAAAQLWFRVDRESASGQRETGAFDNMQDRPIKSPAWQDYEIVLQVNDDAEKIVMGMFVVGRGKAWIDDASLEIVDPETPTTGGSANSTKPTAPKSRFSPVLMKAFQEADKAPQQSFWTPWLWLVAMAMTLFALSGLPAKEVAVTIKGESQNRMVLGQVAKFSLRFSFVYWLLYSFPKPFTSISPWLTMKFNAWYNSVVNQLVHWTARNVFGIEGELVPLNGSGDTTFAYINLFVWFILSLVVAVIWSLSDWRKTDYRIIKDLLRSYLRYVIAFSMLGYGLAKFGWATSQFPEPSIGQLMKTYGDASPMNLVWTFMGSSRPYTMFAGLAEVIGALLLIWRRTSTLGALVVLGVMTNVMMLNFCYDVPVKIYSFHLVCMALYLLLPETGRLANVLFWNRPTISRDQRPPYTGPITIWIQRIFKACILIVGFGIPILTHTVDQFKHFETQASLPEFFDIYEVDEFKLNGAVVSADMADTTAWFAIEFDQMPFRPGGGMSPTNMMTVIHRRGMIGMGTFTIENETTLNVVNSGNPSLPLGTVRLTPQDKGRFLLSGKTAKGEIEVLLNRRGKDLFRLTGRGFRWINEVPFNR